MEATALAEIESKQREEYWPSIGSDINDIAAVSDDDDSENDESADDTASDSNPQTPNAAKMAAKESDKYLVPLEVEAQIKLLWSKDGDLLHYIWNRTISNSSLALSAENSPTNAKASKNNSSSSKKVIIPMIDPESMSNSWQIFFTRIVLVPPNKFRPQAKIGNEISDHPQNTHLKKIIEFSTKVDCLRLVEQSSSSKSDSSKKKKKDSSDTTLEQENKASSNSFELSKIVSAWIELQNSVNCYFDSAKDPNPLKSANSQEANPLGIRQLLERKEGLFRKNMMGKRVNYCCRSVISPDPYLGTNEIGIPVNFAKTLQYPVPVNDWNVKYLRTLVERGPFEYPGI